MHLGHISVNYSSLLPNTNLSQVCIFLNFVMYLILNYKIYFWTENKFNIYPSLLCNLIYVFAKHLVFCVGDCICADVHTCWKCRCQGLHMGREEHGCLALSPFTLFPWDGSLIEPGLRLTVSKLHKSPCLCPFPSTGVTGVQAASPRFLQ